VSDVASREGGNPYHGLIYFFSKIFFFLKHFMGPWWWAVGAYELGMSMGIHAYGSYARA
jgi:hypothetical protein